MSKRGRGVWDAEMGSVDTGRVIMLLAQQQYQRGGRGAQPLVMRGRVFECKTCSRQFPTFQALGGHRASHKRPRLQQQQHALGANDAALCLGRQPQPAAAKPRVHECPICGLEFNIGQALGGHMRRHRAEAEADTNAPSGKAASEMACDVGGICLDLNLTPSENCAKCRNVVGLGAAGQGGVHKALAMLDYSL